MAGLGWSEACKQFAAVMSLTWAASQVTKVGKHCALSTYYYYMPAPACWFVWDASLSDIKGANSEGSSCTVHCSHCGRRPHISASQAAAAHSPKCLPGCRGNVLCSRGCGDWCHSGNACMALTACRFPKLVDFASDAEAMVCGQLLCVGLCCCSVLKD